jgi:hypothetical protein
MIKVPFAAGLLFVQVCANLWTVSGLLQDYIQCLTCQNPMQFWQEVDKLGPSNKSTIPMEVMDNNCNLMTDINIVLQQWHNDYKGILMQQEQSLMNNFCNKHKVC